MSNNISDIINDINKTYKKKGVNIQKASEWRYTKEQIRLSTGSFGLDLALGGGWPVGGCNEIHGDYGVFKSGLKKHTGAAAIAKGFSWIDIDLDHSEQQGFANEIGKFHLVDDVADKYYMFVEDDGGLIMDIIRRLAQGRIPTLVTIDPINNVEPEALREKSMSDDQMGVKARKMSEFLSRLQSDISTLPEELPWFCFLWIAEEYSSMEQMRKTPEVKGGNKMKYAKFSEVWLKRNKEGDGNAYGLLSQSGEYITTKDRKKNIAPAGISVKYDIRKNKTFGEGRFGFFDAYFTSNNIPHMYPGFIDRPKEILPTGVMINYFETNGSYITIGEEKYQGKSNASDALRSLYGEYRNILTSEPKKAEEHPWNIIENEIKELYLSNSGHVLPRQEVVDWLDNYRSTKESKDA